MPTRQEWIECKGLPRRKCNAFRERNGLPPLAPILGNVAAPHSDHNKKRTPVAIIGVPKNNTNSGTNVATSDGMRGLGDVVAAVTAATGIDKLVKKIAPGGCGCGARQQKLNELVPFK